MRTVRCSTARDSTPRRHSPLLPALLLPALLLSAAGCTGGNLRPWTATDTDTRTLIALADAAYRQGEWDAAARTYAQLADVFPKEAEYRFRLANIHVYQGRLDEAVVQYRAALALDPGHTGAWHNLGFTQLRLVTRTFIDMQEHVDPQAPETARARAVVDAITGMMTSSAGVAPPAEPDEP
jgi:tetratricopeptide (TPR) repeat protein